MDSDMEDVFRRRSNRRRHDVGEVGRKSIRGEEDLRLETTRARLTNVLKRHEDLKNRLSRDSDKLVYERLVKEFAAADAAKSEDQVHMEAERKALPDQANLTPDLQARGKPTYRNGHKVMCCLEGTRIGIQYETFFAGEPCEVYHCVLESKSFLEKINVIEHSIPFFLPVHEAENDLLSSNAMKFIDYIGDILQAYVDRREQVSLIKTLYGNQIGDLYHSLSYNLIEFVLDDFDCKVTVSLRYADLASILPSRIRVLGWPVQASKRVINTDLKTSEPAAPHPIPARLSYAEDALKTMSLPQAFAEIVINLPRALQQLFPPLLST